MIFHGYVSLPEGNNYTKTLKKIAAITIYMKNIRVPKSIVDDFHFPGRWPPQNSGVQNAGNPLESKGQFFLVLPTCQWIFST